MAEEGGDGGRFQGMGGGEGGGGGGEGMHGGGEIGAPHSRTLSPDHIKRIGQRSLFGSINEINCCSW